jgi:hypothetical protein
MGAELGRISGPLLSADLLRNGVDLAFETDLLYLSVFDVGSPSKVVGIGINTDIPNRLLTVDGTSKTTFLQVPSTLTTPEFFVSTNRIQNLVGNIVISPDQTTDPKIVTRSVGADNLRISNGLIENILLNSDINLSPDGLGKVIFTTSEVDIQNNLHATGTITWDGNITFGNADNDSIEFNADINSNIIPNQDITFDLGSTLRNLRWDNLYSKTVTVDSLTVADITANDINLTLAQGNTIYVSVNGDDTNTGTHTHHTYATIKQALSVAVSGDQIVIFPGTYTEIFPLTVPQGVSIRGAGIRAVTVQPTVETNDQDAFLLNGDSKIEFLTVTNFFYNSTANTGYAFRFASNYKAVAKSPYVQNVTITTRGSVTSTADPLGFLQGDAGQGIYLDGSVADPTGTVTPSMLFFSITMIIPNANGLTMLNGSRSEWINCFTYYAKTGINLLNGTLGRYNLGQIYGAELRSINSANVYGIRGIVADGDSTLAYLIGHNFSYIGTGADSSNDPTVSIQGNEVVRFNGGTVYYDSTDSLGNFRIGDIFSVEQSTGVVSFDAQTINFGFGGGIVLFNEFGTSIINQFAIQTGNIRIHDNNIDSLLGPVNFSASSGVTTLNTNVNIAKDLSISGDVSIAGDMITFGDQLSDIVIIVDLLTQTIKPNVTDTYTLGTNTVGDPRTWNRIYLSLLDVDGVTQIDNNTISTLTSDTDLVFDASGSGKVIIATTDVDITNNLTVVTDVTVSGTSSLKNTLTVDITQTGNFNQTGSSDITGNLQSNDILVTDPASYLQLPGILFDSTDLITGRISGRFIDVDVEILTAGTGRIYIPNNDVRLDDNLSVGGTLTVSGNSELTDVNLTGDVTLVGAYNLTGNFDTSGTIDSSSITLTTGSVLTLPRVTIDDSTILGTYLDTDLQLVAAGAGRIYIPNNNVVIDNNLLVNGALTVDNTTSLFEEVVAGNITLTGNYNQTGNTVIDGDLQAGSLVINNGYLDIGNFLIQNQTISGKLPNGDVLYTADGTGVVKIGTTIFFNDAEIGTTAAQNFVSETNEIFIAEDGQEFISEGNDADVDLEITPLNSNLVINSLAFLTLPSSSNSLYTLETTGEIRFDPTSSIYNPGVYGLEGYADTGSQWLMNVFSADRQTGIFESNETINFFTTDETIRSYIDQTGWYTNTSLEVANFNIVGTTISNKNANTDSYLDVTGIGAVLFNNLKFDTNNLYTPNNSALILSNTGVGYVKFNGSNGVSFGAGTNLDYPLTPEEGTVRYNTDLGYSEVYDNSAGWIPLSGQPLSADDFTDVNNLWALILG